MSASRRHQRTTGAEVALGSGLMTVAVGSLVLLADAPHPGSAMVPILASLAITLGLIVMVSAVAQARQVRVDLVASVRSPMTVPPLAFSTAGPPPTRPAPQSDRAMTRQAALIWIERPALPPG